MRKKIYSMLALLCLTVTSAWAQSFYLYDDDEWDDATKTLTVNSDPESNAYYGASDIEHVIISSGVTSIGMGAFMYCTDLTSIEISNSVTSIGEWAFYECSGLTSVTIGNSVTSIGQSAFYGCTNLPIIDNIRYADTYLVEAVDKSLSSYTVKEGTRWIGESAFSGCSGLTSVTIGNSVTSIGELAFNECSGLTSVTIPNSVTSIGLSAFYGCSSLTSIEIPTSVTSIGEGAFSYCTGLTSMVVASGNTKYDSRDNCNAIIETSSNKLISGCQNTIIPNSVKSIVGAFYGCTGLTSITIPNSVTSIGYGAFSACSGLTSITIPTSVTSIGDEAFYDCTGLTSIEIPESVTSIGDYAFYNCPGPTSITIPYSVTSIGEAAFGGCTGLTSMVVANGNTTYDSRDCNAIIETSTNTLIAGCKNTIIPNSVTSIGAGAFHGCNSLTSITIPSSVTSIGNIAFANCQGLTSITIPSSVTSIGANAFYNHYGSNITDVYCYPNAEDLTWNESGCNDFIRQDDKTVCHVFASELTAYQTKFTGTVNVTFVGDLTGSCDVTANLANGAYWATFYSNASNYQAPVGTQVFAVNLDGTTITMIPVEDRIVKSGQGVVLKQVTESSEPTTTITMTLTETAATDSYFSDNSLLGTMTSITNPGNAYVLNYKAATGAGFYKLKSGKTIGANKAYLTYSGAGAREFFLFDEATGIEMPTVEDVNADAVVYDLQGRRVVNPTKGLYIVNGKKVFINK